MLNSQLSNRQESSVPFGRFVKGTIGVDETPVHLYQSNTYDPDNESSVTIVFATGLLTNPKKYSALALLAIEGGDNVVIFGHDHHRHRWPIRANAEDIKHGVECLNVPDKFVAVGHSMGTLALLLALEDDGFKAKTQKLIQVNPVMLGSHLFPMPEDYINNTKEALVIAQNMPCEGLRYVATVLSEFIRRPLVNTNQILRLISGKVHGRYENFLTHNHDLPIDVVLNEGDGLVPVRWAKSLREIGSGFRQMNVYVNDSALGLGHAAIMFDPDTIQGVINLAHGETPDTSTFRLQYRIQPNNFTSRYIPQNA